MNIVINIITIIIIIPFVCTVVSLIGKQVILKQNKINNKVKLLLIYDFFIRFFLSWHIKLIFLHTIMTVIFVFTLNLPVYNIIISIILAIAAIIIERVIEYTQYKKYFNDTSGYIDNNTAVFAYIDLYSEAAKISLDLIKQLSESQSNLLKQSENTNENINNILEKVSDYSDLQNNECRELLYKKNDLINFYDEFGNSAAKFSEEYVQYREKLANSSSALEYYKESESLTADINESFISGYKRTANDFVRRIDDSEKQLRKIVDEYSKFNNLIQPHMQTVNNYNIRMDTALKSLQNGINSKQERLVNTSNEISGNITEAGKCIQDTLSNLNNLLDSNKTILSQVLDTCKANPAVPQELKKIYKNFLSINEKEEIKKIKKSAK